MAAFVDTHLRPQDPRYEGSIEATDKGYHNHSCYYGVFDASIAAPAGG